MANTAALAVAVVAAAAAAAASALACLAPSFETVVSLVRDSAALQLVVSGACVSVLSWVAFAAQRAVTNALWTTVTVRSSETDVWEALLGYLQSEQLLRSKEMLVKKKRAGKGRTWRQRHLDYMLGKSAAMELEYTPGERCDGVIPFKGARILLTRHPDGAKVTVGWNRQVVQPEVIQLRTWGRRPELLKEFLSAAVAGVRRGDEDETNILTIGNEWPYGWTRAVTKKCRSLESVVLDGEVQERILADARDFQASAAWYTEAGIPYRRGYLLYGPPGCGKTSFVQALAAALKLDVCMLSLSNKGMSDNDLAGHLRDAPANSIVLLEDVDAVFHGRELVASATAPDSGVTFSGLLNAIDGAAAQEGRILCMTTNHIEKLDPALIRPGRCDVRQFVGNATRDQMVRLFRRFFKDAGANASAFAAALPEGELSMAKLQGFLLAHRADASGGTAVRDVANLLLQARQTEDESMTAREHLGRLGLEQFAAVFERHGFGTKAAIETGGLIADEVAHWCDVDLATDAPALRRLKLLLEPGERKPLLLEQYSLAGMSAVRDGFVARFPAAAVQAQADPGLPKRSSSSGLARCDSDPDLSADADADAGTGDGHLTRAFVAAVTSGGRSVISTWRLDWILEQHGHDAMAAIRAARKAVMPPSPPAVTVPMSVWTFLLRLGLEKHVDAVERAVPTGTARDAARLSKEDLMDKCGLEEQTAARIVAATSRKPEDASVAREMQCPPAAAVRRLFIARFGPAEGPLSAAYARALTNELGEGRASLCQIEAHLAEVANAGAAVDTAAAALIDVTRPPPPTPPEPEEPTAFVHAFLKRRGLEQYAEGFIAAGLSTRAELTSTSPRPLEERDIEAHAGVANFGDRRAIMRMLLELRGEGEE